MYPDEQMRPVQQVFQRVAGTSPHPATICRWALKGVRGVRLKTYMVDNRRMTTESDVRQFIQRRTEATTPPIKHDATQVRHDLAKELA